MAGAIAFHLAILAGALSAESADLDSDSLLDECAAGGDANLALIEFGTAKYKVTNVDKRGGPPHSSELKVALRGHERRYELRVRRADGEDSTIVDYVVLRSGERIHYRPPLDGSRAPRSNIVIISPRKLDRWVPMEPCQQQHQTWVDPPPFSKRLRYMRGAAKATLSARKTLNGLIEVSFQPSISETRGTYWLSPFHGYALVRAKEWARTWSGAVPSSTYEATFVRANNGAFVVSYRHERDFVPDGGHLRLFRDEEIKLMAIDLVSRPDDNAFNLHGLDLPVGATIRDRVHGRDYEYAVSAVDESAIEVVSAAGPMALRVWLNGVNSLFGAVFLCWLGRKLARRMRRAGAVREVGSPLPSVYVTKETE